MLNFNSQINDLQKILQIASPIFSKGIDNRNAGAILFKIENENVEIKVSNVESFLTINFNTNSKGTGSFFVPDNFFYQIVKELKNGSINIILNRDIDNNFILLSSGKFKCKINCLNLEESVYKTNEITDVIGEFNIKAGDLLKMFRQTACCIETKPQRANLNGVLLHSELNNNANYLNAVSTDGMKLAIVQYLMETPNQVSKILVPKKTCEYISSLLQNLQDDVLVKYSNNMISVNINNISYTSRLIDAEFPKYQSVIPVANNKLLEVNTQDLIRSLKTVSRIGTNSNKITLSLSANELQISSEENGNNSSDVIEATFSEGNEKMDINCNGLFLIDILNNIDSKITRMHIQDAKSPILIRPLDDADVKYVFMPMI